MKRKYELTEETITHEGATLHRIKALRGFGDVQAGDLGGYIEDERNLLHYGICWVGGNARVRGKAQVGGKAWVGGMAWVGCNARVGNEARVVGEAQVGGTAQVGGKARVGAEKDYIVFKNWWSSGRYFTWTRSDNMWTVGCFYGTGEELVAKAYKDSEESGRRYAEIVDYVNRCVLGK